ncbi:MAG: hypothetical protein ABIT64_05300 [Lysobacteraceae bacterium]
MSRVLAELDGVLPLREPPPLLDLAQMLRFFGTARMSLNMGQWQQLFGLTMSLLTRTYSLAETAVIKPISHANNLLPHLLAWHRDCRAALIYVDLPSYLASMLKPSNRSETRRALIESRSMDFQRLTGNPGLDSESLEDGQAAALVWLLQMHEFRQAMQSFELRQRLLPVHFDDFLQGPTESLQQLANFFGLAADASRIDAVLQGAVMHSYSKSPAHAYASNRRTQELHRNAVEYAKEIDSALSWAKDIVDKYPALHLLQDDLASSSRLVTQVR